MQITANYIHRKSLKLVGLGVFFGFFLSATNWHRLTSVLFKTSSSPQVNVLTQLTGIAVYMNRTSEKVRVGVWGLGQDFLTLPPPPSNILSKATLNAENVSHAAGACRPSHPSSFPGPSWQIENWLRLRTLNMTHILEHWDQTRTRYFNLKFDVRAA